MKLYLHRFLLFLRRGFKKNRVIFAIILILAICFSILSRLSAVKEKSLFATASLVSISGKNLRVKVPACNASGTTRFGEKPSGLVNLGGKWRFDNGEAMFTCNELTEGILIEANAIGSQQADRLKPSEKLITFSNKVGNYEIGRYVSSRDKKTGRAVESNYIYFNGYDGYSVLVESLTLKSGTQFIRRRLNEDFELFLIIHNAKFDPEQIIERDKKIMKYISTLVENRK